MAALAITSSAFWEGRPLPAKYACRKHGGEDVNPPLRIRDVPAGTASLALIFDDPDAPAGTWTHWVFWDLDPGTVEIPEKTTAEHVGATPGANSWGRADYGGPCPPSGTHRYVFHLYALDRHLGLPAGSSVDELRDAMRGHLTGQAALLGTFSAPS